MDVGWNETKGDYDNDGIAKQSVSINSAMMVCKREERIFFFYFVFLFIILELLQGLFVT
jgi:hypothetical protein